MAYIQTRQVGAGELISESFAHLGLIKRELAIYFGLFLALGLADDFMIEPLRPLTGLALMVAYFIGQYWLYRTAFARLGIPVDDRFKVFSMFFMALILIFPIYIGLGFFLLPGLLLGAKWVMAPSFLVVQDRDLFKAMGDSWSASDNNTWPLTGAFTIMCMIWLGMIAVFMGVLDAIPGLDTNGLNALQALLFQILPVLLLGLSVAAYRLLANDDQADLISVFE